MISQEEYNAWYGDSIAPISGHFQLLRCSLSTIKRTYSAFVESRVVEYSAGKRKVRWVADLDEVTIARRDLPDLLMPQNWVRGRVVFVETDSEYTAAFFPRKRHEYALEPSTGFYLSWLMRNQLMAPTAEPEFVEIRAVPPSVMGDGEEPRTDAVVCPDPWFVSNGDCSLDIVDYYGKGQKKEFYSLTVGHSASQRSRSIERGDGTTSRAYPADLWTGTDFITSSNTPFEELPYDFADLLFELPEHELDREPEVTLGLAAWDIFGTREMDMICDEFGISPFDKQFYGKRALVATMRAEPCERVEAEPRIDFRSFQRWIGVGPELIWTRD